MKIALAIVLWFTVPSHDATVVEAPSGEVVRLCEAAPDSCRDLASVTVWRTAQSSTWVANRDSMLSNESIWAALWPRVREEALPRAIATYPLSPVMAGARTSAPLPDSLSHGTLFVTFRDTSGNVSCESNLLTVP